MTATDIFGLRRVMKERFDKDHKGLIITVGPPGAGKSTWAEKNLPPHTLRLERDRFRECLFGSRRAYHNSPLSRDERSLVVTEAMRAAMQHWPHPSFAITDTALRYDSIEPFLRECFDLNVTLVIFERSWEWIKHVNETRPEAHRIPDDILSEMFALHNDPDAWWRHRTDFTKITITSFEDLS